MPWKGHLRVILSEVRVGAAREGVESHEVVEVAQGAKLPEPCPGGGVGAEECPRLLGLARVLGQQRRQWLREHCELGSAALLGALKREEVGRAAATADDAKVELERAQLEEVAATEELSELRELPAALACAREQLLRGREEVQRRPRQDEHAGDHLHASAQHGVLS